MVSSFKDTKFYFEDMFQTLWFETPIHYAGQEFDGSDIQHWVNPFYQPTYGSNTDLCSTTLNSGNLHVACWGDSDIEAMDLADNIVSFIMENTDKTKYRIKRFEMSDHGWNDSNKVYVVITFTVEMLVI